LESRKPANIAVILRGLPGSGKSTVAHLFNHFGAIVSMDDFWREQVCTFDSTRLQEAIRWTRNKLKEAIEAGAPFIAVDNTHTRLFEMERSLSMLKEAGYQVHILHVEAGLGSCILRQTHSVPEDKLLAMRDRWEPVCSKEAGARLRAVERMALASLKLAGEEA